MLVFPALFDTHPSTSCRGELQGGSSTKSHTPAPTWALLSQPSFDQSFDLRHTPSTASSWGLDANHCIVN